MQCTLRGRTIAIFGFRTDLEAFAGQRADLLNQMDRIATVLAAASGLIVAGVAANIPSAVPGQPSSFPASSQSPGHPDRLHLHMPVLARLLVLDSPSPRVVGDPDINDLAATVAYCVAPHGPPPSSAPPPCHALTIIRRSRAQRQCLLATCRWWECLHGHAGRAGYPVRLACNRMPMKKAIGRIEMVMPALASHRQGTP